MLLQYHFVYYSIINKKCMNLNPLLPSWGFCQNVYFSRYQWPRGLRCGSAAVRSLRLRVRIPPVAWMPVLCENSVLSGRSLCVDWSLVQRSPTECGVSECDGEASIMRRLWPATGCYATERKVFLGLMEQKNTDPALQLGGGFATFRRVRKITRNHYQLRHVCLSVRPHGRTRLPLDEFSWNLMEHFAKICWENSGLIKI